MFDRKKLVLMQELNDVDLRINFGKLQILTISELINKTNVNNCCNLLSEVIRAPLHRLQLVREKNYVNRL